MTASRKKLQDRREAAIQLFEQGYSKAEVAKRLGVSRTSAARWGRKWTAKESLGSRSATGRPCSMTEEQSRLFREYVIANPKETVLHLREWIVLEFGIRYSLDHVGRAVRIIRGQQ